MRPLSPLQPNAAVYYSQRATPGGLMISEVRMARGRWRLWVCHLLPPQCRKRGAGLAPVPCKQPAVAVQVCTILLEGMVTAKVPYPQPITQMKALPHMILDAGHHHQRARPRLPLHPG